MADEDLSPEDAAIAEAERKRAQAQDAASELARVGIDPRALGLDAAGSGTGNHAVAPGGPAADPPTGSARTVAAGRPSVQDVDPGGQVVPLRPEFDAGSLPASGTSSAWAPAPPSLGGGGQGAAWTAPPVPVEALFGTAPAPPARPSATHLARSVTFGLLTPDAAETADHEREMVARIRTRTTEHQTVVFVSGKGGVGVTTVALGVGSVFAALRDDTACVASMRSGAPSVGRALLGTPAITARELITAKPDVEPTRLPNGLLLVDGPRWTMPIRRNDLGPILDRIQQVASFGLFDVGNDVGEASSSLLSRADQVVVVTSAGADGLDSARLAAERVADFDPLALDAAVFVVVCRQDSSLKRIVRRMREVMPDGARIVAVPPDPYLGEGQLFSPGKVGVGTRLAFLDLGGLIALGHIGRSQ